MHSWGAKCWECPVGRSTPGELALQSPAPVQLLQCVEGTSEAKPRNEASARSMASHSPWFVLSAAEGTGFSSSMVPNCKGLVFPLLLLAQPSHIISELVWMLTPRAPGRAETLQILLVLSGPQKRVETKISETAIKCCSGPVFCSISESFPQCFHRKVEWVLKRYHTLQLLLNKAIKLMSILNCTCT